MAGMAMVLAAVLATAATSAAVEKPTGIRTDRLSRRQLRVWKGIEAVVLARDRSGRLRNPTLHGLWQSVETSGHAVYIELAQPKNRWDHQAGRFDLEQLDPGGKRHVAAIRLALPVIDQASERRGVRKIEVFVRFAELRKKERYAEVLAHELAHAVWALAEPSNARLLEEFRRETDAAYSRYVEAVQRGEANGQMREELKRLQSRKDGIEKPAEAAEAEVWRELRGRRPGS